VLFQPPAWCCGSGAWLEPVNPRADVDPGALSAAASAGRSNLHGFQIHTCWVVGATEQRALACLHELILQWIEIDIAHNQELMKKDLVNIKTC